MSDHPADAARVADAFGVLSDPVRVAILRELSDREHPAGETSVPFAELRRAVGVDDAGRFNYHLDKLRDQFVRKRDGGYAPTAVGLRAIGSIESGTYSHDPEPRSGLVDHDCPHCGAALTARYENHYVSVECDDHGLFLQRSVPPTAVADATIEDVLAFAVGDVHRDLRSLADGVCFVCSAPVAVAEFEETEDGHVNATFACENCWLSLTTRAAAAVMGHPAVVSLYYDHGVDAQRELPASLSFVWDPDSADLTADGSAVELTVAVGDDDVTLRVDDTLAVDEV
ncbi:MULTISPECIES: ArsR/SmtB family transcription factor [unclassified Halobacterium]|uniref:Helix-turn-helix domain-containing protein n=1 Tax=Halobacterium sp. NMX12-1 TaxID=3166650 RepID=A0AAU8CIQ8_9EURY|nr:helix-turn-helix domain-containing protein [Halobacterium sp. KA-6]MCD2202202.1 helix-turn-helix domain-containing protein [Halobacterium sp. KA-6]